jgi:hypothetical protein
LVLRSGVRTRIRASDFGVLALQRKDRQAGQGQSHDGSEYHRFFHATCLRRDQVGLLGIVPASVGWMRDENAERATNSFGVLGIAP